MRNTTCMSDYSEVQHGFQILLKFFSDNSRKKAFTDALDECSRDSGTEAISLFDQWWSDIEFNTYITSISEHDDKENFHGRLSMWRAFGTSTTRVAIVFNVPWYWRSSIEHNLEPCGIPQ
jgi:hypothetical protein